MVSARSRNREFATAIRGILDAERLLLLKSQRKDEHLDEERVAPWALIALNPPRANATILSSFAQLDRQPLAGSPLKWAIGMLEEETSLHAAEPVMPQAQFERSLVERILDLYAPARAASHVWLENELHGEEGAPAGDRDLLEHPRPLRIS